MHLKYMEPDSPFYRDKDIRDGWLWEPDSSLPLIRFHSLDREEWLEACFTTRRGGVSTGYLAELNLGFARGDVPENVWMNYLRVTDRLGISLDRLALTHQVHETELLYADESLTLGEERKRKIFRTDGLYTDREGILLSATFADCVPVYLADRSARQIALVHSGWKGTVGEISGKAVQVLCGRGSRPDGITAVIGPCISGAHYEVTGEVAEAVQSVFGSRAAEDILTRTDEIHWLCDLPAAIWHTLRKAGIPEENIHFSGYCTYENPELFSHRKSRGLRGNMNAFMMIRQEN